MKGLEVFESIPGDSKVVGVSSTDGITLVFELAGNYPTSFSVENESKGKPFTQVRFVYTKLTPILKHEGSVVQIEVSESHISFVAELTRITPPIAFGGFIENRTPTIPPVPLSISNILNMHRGVNAVAKPLKLQCDVETDGVRSRVSLPHLLIEVTRRGVDTIPPTIIPSSVINAIKLLKRPMYTEDDVYTYITDGNVTISLLKSGSQRTPITLIGANKDAPYYVCEITKLKEAIERINAVASKSKVVMSVYTDSIVLDVDCVDSVSLSMSRINKVIGTTGGDSLGTVKLHMDTLHAMLPILERASILPMNIYTEGSSLVLYTEEITVKIGGL